MKQRDVMVLMDGIAPVIVASIGKAMAPLLVRVEFAEKRLAELLAVPPVDVDALIAKALAARPPVEPVDLAAIERGLDARMEERFAAQPKVPTAKEVAAEIPAPENGKDVDPLIVKAMIAEAVAELPPAKDGASVTLDDVRPLLETALKDALAALPAPQDGKSVTIEDLRPLIEDLIARAAAALPGPKEIDPEMVKAMVADAVSALPPAKEGQPGKDADPAMVAAAIADAMAGLPPVPTAVEVAALVPRPADGKSITVDDVLPIVKDLVAGAFATVSMPKDADPEAVRAIVVEEVARVAAGQRQAPTAEEVAALVPAPPTLEQILTALPAPQPGENATPEQIAVEVEKVLATWERPRNGESVTIEQLRPVVDGAVEKAVAALPTAKNGNDGRGIASLLKDHEGFLVATFTDGTVERIARVDGAPGADGLGFDDLDVIDAGMTFTLRFTRGELTKEWTLAKPTLADCYRGVWRDGSHKAGTAVTWGGSLWIAQRDTEAKPESNDDWKLAVKRGRDGQDLRLTEPAAPKPVKLK